MDKHSFVKLLKKEGYHIDDSKAIPTVLCSPGDYISVIKAVKKIKSESEYDESFSVKKSSLEQMHESSEINEDISDMAPDDNELSEKPSNKVVDSVVATAEENVDPADSFATEETPDGNESVSDEVVSDFFSVFDPFD